MFRTVNVTDKIILQKKLGGYFCQADIFLGGKGSAALMCCMTYYVFHLYLTIPSLALRFCAYQVPSMWGIIKSGTVTYKIIPKEMDKKHRENVSQKEGGLGQKTCIKVRTYPPTLTQHLRSRSASDILA